MAKQEKFARVGADLKPDKVSDSVAHAVKKTRGARSRAAARGGQAVTPKMAVNRRILALTWLGLAFMMLYALTIGLSLWRPGYSWLDRVGALALLFGIGFIVVHGLGYSNSVIKANWGYHAAKPPLFASFDSPRVTCLVASFNEPPDVLDETVAAVCALDYPNKDIVILDDSTKPANQESAREIAEKYGVRCVQRTNRRGYKAGAINDFLPKIESPYIAMFDADALPTPQFLRECIPQIHENPKLGFLQTPQFYVNTDVSYVALAAARQQNVFYETICEGKSVSRAAFCCGTNVIFRRAALEDVGGFDETNVTEDFATSFFMHYAGWDSLYLNRVYVYSLAPENLAAYFTQQSRWSFGTLGTARSFVQPFLKNPRALSAGQWWEYFLSTTYYWIGWVNFIFICLPLLYLFFGIKPLRQDVSTYLLVFVPYMLFTLNMFYSSMGARGYKIGEMILGQQIGFISFPIHMSSALSGLLGKKRPFGVTPKGVGGRIPWQALWFQLLMLGLSAFAFLLGTYRWVAGIDRNSTAVIINSMWALYHVWMLSSVFRLNQNVREGAQKWYFDDSALPKRAAPLAPLEGVKNPLTVRRLGGLVGLVTATGLGMVALGVWQVLSWSAAPVVPVNVFVVDRTLSRDGGQHRALLWTLNYLKIAKQPTFGPSGGARTTYDANLDYFGAVSNPQSAPTKAANGDLIYNGFDRPLPTRLSPPGALYLADTYGETSEYDVNLAQTVRYRATRRGLSVEEIDHIETFARRGGLVMAEWNTLGYPTRPGNFIAPALLERAIEGQRARIARLTRQTIPAARANLTQVEQRGSFRALSVARGQLEDARGALIDANFKLRGLRGAVTSNAVGARQSAAAARLEKLFGVRSAGWYGRFVEDFGLEKQYNPALYKVVQDDMARRGAKNPEPSGPGFVFYPDGPTRVFDVQSGAFRPAKFTRPMAILGAELGATLTGDSSLIEKATDSSASDPLLAGVGDHIPARNWFDVVVPQVGARVLASYHLKISAAAVKRLKDNGFPAQFLAPDGQSVIFPALVATRDSVAAGGSTPGGKLSGGKLSGGTVPGGTALIDNGQGALRSLYLAGDVAGYAAIPDAATRFPALGRVDELLSGRFGSFPSRFYWNFSEPILRGALTRTPRLRFRD